MAFEKQISTIKTIILITALSLFIVVIGATIEAPIRPLLLGVIGVQVLMMVSLLFLLGFMIEAIKTLRDGDKAIMNLVKQYCCRGEENG